MNFFFLHFVIIRFQRTGESRGHLHVDLDIFFCLQQSIRINVKIMNSLFSRVKYERFLYIFDNEILEDRRVRGTLAC